MLTRTLLTLAMAGFALTGTAKADTYSHIDGLAVQLTRNARLLEREFAAHYRHTSRYRHLREDARQMIRLADHVHEVAHHEGSLSHLQSDLRQLDRLFHHIEELVDEIEHDAAGLGDDHHGHFGNFGGYHGRYGGHIHGNTRHVRRILSAMEDTLHHLQDDVRQLARAAEAHRHHDHPGPVIRFSRPGFSFWLGQ